MGVISGTDLVRALDPWGQFSGVDRAFRPHGEWIRAEGELTRTRFDRTEFDLLRVAAPRFAVQRTPEYTARRAHTGHIIVVQLAGTSVLHPKNNAAPVRLEPGDISCGDPSVPYTWEFEGEPTVMLIRLPVGAMRFPQVALSPLLGVPLKSTSEPGGSAIAGANSVLASAHAPHVASVQRLVADAVARFESLIEYGLRSTAQREQFGPHAQSEPSFQRVLAHIDAHLTEPMTVGSIAEHCGMSARTLHELFRLRGLRVAQWVKLRRLERARAWLANCDVDRTDMDRTDMTRIALASGFADHAHFTRCFRAAYGETPSAWRARNSPADQ